MSAQLGIHARVFVGWCPDWQCSEIYRDARMKKGTVLDGPCPTGSRLWWLEQPGTIVINRSGETAWKVQTDDGIRITVAESMLSPIDDDGESLETEREREVTA